MVTRLTPAGSNIQNPPTSSSHFGFVRGFTGFVMFSAVAPLAGSSPRPPSLPPSAPHCRNTSKTRTGHAAATLRLHDDGYRLVMKKGAFGWELSSAGG